MIEINQLGHLVIIPTLTELGDNFCTPEAVLLLLMTAAQESLLGSYISQYPKGPAKGIYQMEKIAYVDCVERYIKKRPVLYNKILAMCNFSMLPKENEMVTNLKFATIMCRLKYAQSPERIPASNDIEGLAKYWKKHYNTYLGKGTPKECESNYNRYIKKQWQWVF